MIWVAAIVLCCLGTELFNHLPIIRAAHRITTVAQTASRVIRSPRISDHWKELVLGAYARRMARGTLILCLWIAAFAAAITVMLGVGDRLVTGVPSLLMTVPGLLLACAVSAAYHAGRGLVISAP